MTARAALAALALVPAGLLGCTGGGEPTDPATAVPPDALAYAEVLVRPEGDQRADALAAARAALGTADLAGVAREHGIDLRSVQGWLGDRVAVALTPRGKLVVAATTDGEAALRAVRRKVGRRGTAVVEGRFLLAGSPRAVAAARRAVGGDEDLAASSRFEQAMEDASAEGALGRAYADVDALVRAGARRAQGSPQAAIGAAAVGALGLETVGAAFEADGRALRVRGALRSEDGLPRGGGDAAAALAAAPAGSAVAVGIADVGGTAGALLDRLGPLAGAGLAAVGLDREALAWMGDATFFTRGRGGALVVQSEDPAASRAALPRFARVLRGRRATFEGAELAFRRGPYVLAQAGSRVVLARGADAARAALRGGGATLGTQPRFREAASRLEGGARPSLWLDPAAFARFADPEHRDVLRRLGGLVAGARPDGDLERFEAVLALG